MARNKHLEVTIQRILDTAERLFIEKGYDHASLQDIIDATGLSKGAIYHHFASKVDIFYAVFDRIGQHDTAVLSAILNDNTLNGLDKLRAVFKASLQPERQDNMVRMLPYLLDNPKFLAMELRNIFVESAPQFIEPIIRQGIADGSIQTDHPRELAEAMLVLTDIWGNPTVRPTTPEEMKARCAVFNQMFTSFGIPALLDREIIDYLMGLAELAQHRPPDGAGNG